MIRIAASARSAIETDVIDGRDDEHDPPCYAVLREAFHAGGGNLAMPAAREGCEALIEALTDLANAYDDQAEGRGASYDAARRRFARDACKGLTSAATLVRAAQRAREVFS